MTTLVVTRITSPGDWMGASLGACEGAGVWAIAATVMRRIETFLILLVWHIPVAGPPFEQIHDVRNQLGDGVERFHRAFGRARYVEDEGAASGAGDGAAEHRKMRGLPSFGAHQ